MDDFFGKLGDKIVSGGKAVGDKAKELSDATKIQIDIRKNEDILTEEFAKIGKKYYEEHKDSDPTEFQTIAATERQIAHLKQQLRDIRGTKVCPACGAENDDDAGFCKKCGAKLETGEKADAEVADEETKTE